MRHPLSTVGIAVILALAGFKLSSASIPTCDIHNGMKVWFLEYSDNDYALAHPLGVLQGTVEINETKWHFKCAADGPGTKIYVPFKYTKNGKIEEDTRWPQDVYRTKSEAERAFHHSG